MSYHNINEIWMEAFNAKFPKYEIVSILLYDAYSCVYLLSSGLELRITTNASVYHISKELRNKQFKHVANIFECFSTTLPNEYNNEEKYFCIISERLVREFKSKDVVQSGIDLFRNTWRECIKPFSQFDNVDVAIEERYASKDVEAEKLVLETILCSGNHEDVVQIAIALHDALRTIKELDSDSYIHMSTDYIGLSGDGIIKICNIDHEFIGLENCYEIDVQESSVTVKYNPVEKDDRNGKMLMPLNVDFGHGKKIPVLAQIDIEAKYSALSDSFFKRACLEDFDSVGFSCPSNEYEPIKIRFEVEFPNKYKATFEGFTMEDRDDIRILIGMDLLRHCEFSLEPYENGFKYELVFKVNKNK